MNITQTFYNNLASQYDKLFLDWQSIMHEYGRSLLDLLRWDSKVEWKFPEETGFYQPIVIAKK